MKPSNSGLDQLLKDASTLGTLDSEGSFTIAGDAALGKLSSFQLPRPSAWILKIIQAAVASRAESLEIRQNKETTDFIFQAPEELSIEELKQALLSPEVHGGPAVEHLAVGLRTVGFGDKRSFTLVSESEGIRTLLAWDRKQLSESSQRTEAMSHNRLRLLVAFPPEDLGKRFAGLAKSTGRAATEYLEVARNAELCPIPLRFDGRRIDSAAAPPPPDNEGKTVPLSLGWTPISKGHEGGKMRLPSGVLEHSKAEKMSDRFTDERVFHIDGELDETELSSLAKLSYSYRILHYGSKYKRFEFRAIKRPSEYAWVKHGVICHREKSRYRSSPVSFQIYLPADDLPTDISGLTIKTDETTQERKNLARERLLFQLENTLEALGNHFPKPFPRDAVIGGIVAGACIFAGPFTLGKSLWGSAISFATIANSTANKKQLMNNCKMYLKKMGDQLRFPEPI